MRNKVRNTRYFNVNYSSLNTFFDSNNRAIFLNAFISTFFCGFIVHFYMLANSFLNHDTMHYYTNNGDWLVQQGKWFVTPINSVTGPYTLRYLDGVIGLLAVAATAGFICWMFSVKSKVLCWIIGGALVSFPSVATILIYQGLDYFAIASLLSVIAAFFLQKKQEICKVFGVICLVLSIGAYQPFLGFTLALMVVDCIILLARNTHLRIVIYKGIHYIIDIFISLMFYALILKICLMKNRLNLIDYKGINRLSTNLSPHILIKSIIEAYKDVCSFFLFDCFGSYGNHFCLIYFLAIIITVICFFIIVYKNGTISNKGNIITAIFLGIVILPISINIAGVISSNSSFYYISIYPFVIVCLLPVLLLSSIDAGIDRSNKKISGKAFSLIIVMILLLLCGKWTIQDNIAYQKLEFANKQITSKLTILVAEIQEAKGFNVDTPVVLFGDVPFPLFDTTTVSSSFDELDTEGMTVGNAQYEMNDRNQIKNYLNIELGIEFNYIDSANIINDYRKEVDSMSVYPNDGSIEMVDGMLFVKLSDNTSSF